MSALTLGEVFTLEDTLSSERISAFGRAGGDMSASHFDDAEARRLGYPAALAHGMLGMALAGRLFTRRFGPASIRSLTSRFTAMTFHGDRLTVTAVVGALDREAGTASFTFTVLNQHGTSVLLGRAEIAPEQAAFL